MYALFLLALPNHLRGEIEANQLQSLSSSARWPRDGDAPTTGILRLVNALENPG
jgi:hypothetical protein